MEANMSHNDTNDWSRRDFLRLGWAVASGVALPPALYGCFGATPDIPSTETFVEPQVLASRNGRLDDADGRLSENDARQQGSQLAQHVASITALTLRVNVGDTLRVLVDNFAEQDSGCGPVKHLRYPNSMNLHTHGLTSLRPGVGEPAGLWRFRDG
jgi:FtsP/CotA-like multicopper oxidase with cupredoxin domain